ncbi:hypothetical protein QQ045_013495 [Rhodiola kirilowii]
MDMYSLQNPNPSFDLSELDVLDLISTILLEDDFDNGFHGFGEDYHLSYPSSPVVTSPPDLVSSEDPLLAGLLVGCGANSLTNSIMTTRMIPNETRKRKGDDALKPQRVAFKTKSKLDVLDDGYRWRKYGKKPVKNSPNPRNYYKCTSGGCQVKKIVERWNDDSSYVITQYDGVHTHESPSSNYYNNNYNHHQ